MEKTLESIARQHFAQLAKRAEPFAIQNSDAADFIEVSIAMLRDALVEAYNCGMADAAQGDDE